MGIAMILVVLIPVLVWFPKLQEPELEGPLAGLDCQTPTVGCRVLVRRAMDFGSPIVLSYQEGFFGSVVPCN